MRVLIVGGGLIGSSIAWRLTQRGAQVTLIDAGNLGGEASPAGAGMLSPGAEGGERTEAVSLGVDSLRLYPAFVDELHAATGMPIDFRVTGCLAIGGSEEQAAAHERAGIRVERRDEGLFYPDDALVDPRQLLAALRCAAPAQRRTMSEIDPGDWDAVVIAAGAWSGTLRVKGVQLPESVPVKGHLIGFAMRPGMLGPFLREGSTYVLQRADGSVVAGSNEEYAGFDTAVDERVCEALHRDAAKLLPALEGASPSKKWIGFRPWTEGGPHIGRVEGANIWLAYGHYRNGILLTPVTADRIATSVLRDA